MPALYALAFRRLLPEHFAVVGAARSEETDDEFRERMKEAVQTHARDEFRAGRLGRARRAACATASLEFADADGEDRLAHAARRARPASAARSGNRVYYFAVPPSAIGDASSSAIAERRAPERLGAADHREAVRPRPRLGARR